MAPAQASLLAKLDTQERVRDFLTNAVASGRASHAYLFLGAPGAGKLDAAWALAQAFLCEQDAAEHATAAYALLGIRILTCTITRPRAPQATSLPRPASCSMTCRWRHPCQGQGLHHRSCRATAR